MNAIELARKYLRPYKIVSSEVIPMHCPFCGGGEKRDKYTFALNLHNNNYNCKRGKCGKAGTFFGLAKLFNETADKEKSSYKPKKASYIKPSKRNLRGMTDKGVEYLAERLISLATIEKNKIVTDDKGNIAFPFFDENEEFVFLKYRSIEKKKMWREKQTKPILYGMQHCDNEYPLIIVEGEIDKLTLDECSVINAVSVPSGSEDFEWVDNCYYWLLQFQEIIIFGDNDSAGQKMIEQLARRVGEYKCKVVDAEHYKDCKDANEIYVKYGKEQVIKAIKNAKDYQMSGLIRLSDAKAFDMESSPKIKFNIEELDNYISLMLGQVSIVTGTNASGKSTFLSQILAECIEQNYRVCAYSGELPAPVFRFWFELQMAGPKHIKEGKVIKTVSNLMRSWYKDKFFFLDCFNDGVDDDIIKTFEYVYKRYDVKVFLIDNLMTVLYTDVNEKDYYRRQSQFVGKMITFAHKYNAHVIIVAHPKKTKERVSKEDVGGLMELTNRVDNVIAVHRLSEAEIMSKKYGDSDAIIEVLKNRYSGHQEKKIGLRFDTVSKRFYRWNNDRTYSWDVKSFENECIDDNPFTKKGSEEQK